MGLEAWLQSKKACFPGPMRPLCEHQPLYPPRLLKLRRVRADPGAKPMAEVLLRVTLNDELDYRTAFDEVYYKHFSQSDLISVDSDGTGTLELVYSVTLRKGADEQALLHDLRQVDSSMRSQLIHGHATVNI